MQILKQGKCVSCGACCRQNDPFLGLPQQCIFYKSDGVSHCKIYSARPDVCKRFPTVPRDVACLNTCGYSFIDEKGCKIDMYMLKSTEKHLQNAVKRRNELRKLKVITPAHKA